VEIFDNAEKQEYSVRSREKHEHIRKKLGKNLGGIQIMNENIEKTYDRKLKIEKIDGRIYLMATPCREHREIQGNLNTIFNNYFRQNKRRCRAIIEDRLDIDENNFFEPDAKVLCRESRNDDIPVIVIEVLSKSTRGRDLGIKMKKYASIKIKEYWIVTWETLSIDTYILNENNEYELYESYACFASEAELKRLDEDEQKTIVGEFSPLSFPELIVRLEDVFDIFE
jgi:Uma2 family endonuclease